MRTQFWSSATFATALFSLAACDVAPDRILVPEVLAAPVSAAFTPGSCDFDRDDASLTSAGWATAFDEPFSTNLSKWKVWTGGAFNNELQHYQASNLHVANGILSISARRETVVGATTPFNPALSSFDYTSGRIESVTHFSAGQKTPNVRMAARLKLAAGYGMWPAFWSYGDPWPTQGEIDIMEARGQLPYEYSTAYWYGRRSGVNQVQNSAVTIQTGSSLTDCWHVYEVIWTKDNLTFLLDGQVVDAKSGGMISNMFRKQQRLTLNLAVGGNFFANFDPSQIQTGTMLVDWVKVFTK
jgi:beta-glucanase (GH16 family)